MGSFKEILSRRVSRRGFINLAGFAATSFVVSRALGCEAGVTEEPKPTPRPTFPDSTPTKARLTPIEATPTPEIINLSGVNLTAEFLTTGLTGIGGATEINWPEAKETIKGTLSEHFDYTLRNWGEAGKFEDLAKDPVLALKYLLSFGQAGAFVSTTFTPERMFPKLADLRFFRTTLETLPEKKKEEGVKGSLPEELLIRQGTHLTIVGSYEEKDIKWYLTSFDEGFDRAQKGMLPREVPRQFFSLVPEAELKNLLIQNNLLLLEGKISFKDEKGRNYFWQVNTIEKNFFETLKKETGRFWVDQRPDGNWYEDPVVPYPPESLIGDKQYQVIKTKEGKILAQDPEGKTLAEAKFNEKTKKWEWELSRVSIPEVISKETAQFVTWSPEKIDQAIQESWQKGEFKTVINFDIRRGGEIRKVYQSWLKEETLVIFLPEGEVFTFISPQSENIYGASVGKIIGAVTIRKGDGEMGIEYVFPSNGEVLVRRGQRVGVGDPIFKAKFIPDSAEQKRFEISYGLKSTMLMAFVDPISRKEISVQPEHLLTDERGRLVTFNFN